MADDAIEVEFQLNLDDMVAFNLAINKEGNACLKTRSFWVGLGSFLFIIFFAFAIAAYDKGLSPELGLAVGIIIGLLAGIAICFFILPVLTMFNTRQAAAIGYGDRNLSLFSPCKFRISPLRVRSTSHVSDNKTSWQAVEKIKKVDTHLFIFIGPYMAMIIPKRAFADEAAFERFYEKCVEYWHAAQGRDPAAEGAV